MKTDQPDEGEKACWYERPRGELHCQHALSSEGLTMLDTHRSAHISLSKRRKEYKPKGTVRMQQKSLRCSRVRSGEHESGLFPAGPLSMHMLPYM